jgi:uncharacterized protein (DUF2147 family)
MMLALAAAPMLAHAQSTRLDVTGVWMTQARDGRVDISDCGNGSPCGRIIWIEPRQDEPPVDARNPNPTLRNRPLVGILMISGFTKRDDQWRGGRIYEPSSGRTYASNLRLAADGTLRVSGCVGPFCQAQTWTRAP